LSLSASPNPVAARPPSSSFFASPEKRTLVLSLSLVVITLLLYNRVSHFSFLNFDDERYVTDNLHVRAGLHWSTVAWAVTSTTDANWHPLTWLSHALDCQLFGMNPAGPHFINVLLHALSAVLLFLLLARSTGRTGASFFVAALFAVHPLNVESVAWVAERKNVLSTLFFFFTLGAYGGYAIRPGWKRYLAVIALFICGLASKPMLVTLPFVLLLLDYWPLCRMNGCAPSPDHNFPHPNFSQARFSTLLLEKLPLVALSIADSAITLASQRAGGAMTPDSRFPFPVRLENAIYCYAQYVWKAFWPTKLAAFYPHPGSSLTGSKILLSVLFLAAVSGLVLKFRSSRYLLAGWLFFLGTLVPVIGLVQVGGQAMADRYAYIPLLGIFVMAVWGAANLADSQQIPWISRAAVSGCILLALFTISYRQIEFWKDSFTLWTHALAVTQNNFFAEDALGGALLLQGRLEEAYPHYQRALAINPDDPMAHANIGAYLEYHGQRAEAVPQFQAAIRLCSDSRLRGAFYAALGSTYRELGGATRAEQSFDQALQLDPNLYNAWLGKGELAFSGGQTEDAARYLLRSVNLRPTGEGYLALGRAFARMGRSQDAVAAYHEALRVSPGMTEAEQAAAALSSAISPRSH
jgi:Tfp pilus assembly protein PilF